MKSAILEAKVTVTDGTMLSIRAESLLLAIHCDELVKNTNIAPANRLSRFFKIA